MGLIAPLALALLLGPGVDDDWDATWALVRQCDASADAGERAELLRRLDGARGQADPGPRRMLLEATVARLRGGSNGAAAELDAHLALVDAWPFDVEESWLAAAVLDDGPQRTAAYGSALTEPPPSSDALVAAWEYGTRCVTEHLWLDDALFVQELLHGHSQATWSANNWATTLQRAGQVELADAVLAEQVERERAAGNTAAVLDLTNTRGIHALGRGDEHAARGHLGRALAGGYIDSGLVLSRLDLDRGDLPRARAGFRALLVEPEPHAWALRGWGVALLPAPTELAAGGPSGAGGARVPPRSSTDASVCPHESEPPRDGDPR